MKKTKQIISALLTIAMMLTIVQPNIFASDTAETSDNRAKINMVFMGKSETTNAFQVLNDTPAVASTPTDASTWTADPTNGTIFWVGLQLSDMAKMDATASAGDDAAALTYESMNGNVTTISHFTRYTSADTYDYAQNGGIFFIGAGIEYASKYVKPAYASDAMAVNSIGNTMKKIDSRYNSYSVSSASIAAEISVADNREESKIAAENEPKLFYMNIGNSGDIGTKIFAYKNDINDDPLCILAVPFRLIEMPPTGTKIFQTALNPANFEIQTGAAASGQDIWKASWNSDRNAEGMVDRNLKNHFDYGGDLNLFPDEYTVEFYGTRNETSGALSDHLTDKDLTVAEDGKVSDTEGAAVPGESDFATYVPEGKVYSGLKYIDSNGDPQEFTADTKITADMVTDKVLKVYADYATGHTVTFNSNYPTEVTDPEATTKPITISPKVGSTIPTDKEPTVGKATDNPAPDFVIPEGYSFEGWYTEATGGDKITFGAEGTGTTIVTSETDKISTVYAHWSQDVIYTFELNYDGAPEAQTVKKKPNEAIGTDAPADPTRADYTFKGWDTLGNGTGTRYADNAALQTLSGEDSMTLYAIWEVADSVPPEQRSTLTFNSSVDGLDCNPASITVKTGDKVIASQFPTPTRDKYDLEGWYTAADITGTKVDVPVTVSEDKTIYAHWKIKDGVDPVTVTFKAPDATDPADPKEWTVTIAQGDSVGNVAPVVKRTGYGFKNWLKEGTTTVFATTEAVNSDTVVTADWTKQITVNFDANTGTGTFDPQVGLPTVNFTAPETAPTKTDYTFVGWNTQKNGSGLYAESTNTLQDVYDARADKTTDNSEVTVYAQWAVVDPEDKEPVKGDTPVDPAENGVRVTFDSNAAGSTDQTGIVDAKPKYKYPKYGEAIGDGQMPNNPERPHYKFVKWNTKQDGTGVDVGATTAIGANLGDAITKIAGSENKYAVTLYAQWDIADGETNKVTLTFNTNINGDGMDANPKQVTIYEGDSLGYVPSIDKSINDGFDYKGANGWFDGLAGEDGGDTEFTAATVPTGDTTYYIDWYQYLVMVPSKIKGIGEGGADVDFSADKLVYANKTYTILYDIYTAKLSDDPNNEDGYDLIALKKDDSNQDMTDVDLTAAGSEIVVSYKNTKNETELKNTGKYTVDMNFAANSELETKGCEILGSKPEDVTITPALVTVKVDPDTQVRKATDTDKAIGITYEGFFDNEPTGKGEASATVQYKKWTPADKTDTAIDTIELGTESTNVPADVSKYVVEVKIADENYKVAAVESSVTGKTAVVYPREADANYPGYSAVYTQEEGVWHLSKPGENIYYEIQVSDPSIKAIEVVSKKGTTLSDPIGLKKPDYSADQTFETGENPTVKDYGVRVTDTEAETAVFTVDLQNPDTTSIKATIKTPAANPGDPDVDTQLAVVQAKDNNNQPIPGKFVIEVPLTNKGADTNDLTITTQAGTDGPTLNYTFKVQQLVEAKIELNPGNSPVGEIMRDNVKYPDTAAKEAAIQNFKDTRVFSGVSNNQEYYVEAWNSYITRDGEGTILSSYDGDLDPTALFVFQRKAFTDPGFKLYDSEGKLITDANVINSVKLTLSMDSYKGGFASYTATDNVTSISADANAKGNNYVFDDFVNYNIRPDVYELNYSFNDPITNDEVTGVRKIIAISRHGDVSIDVNNTLQGADATEITTHITVFAADTMNSLYKFRIADTDINSNKVIQGADATEVKTNIATGLPEFYKEISNE